ncbi:hypothetical protein ACI2JR_14295 [Klebsiella sp. NPDC088457]
MLKARVGVAMSHIRWSTGGVLMRRGQGGEGMNLSRQAGRDTRHWPWVMWRAIARG